MITRLISEKAISEFFAAQVLVDYGLKIDERVLLVRFLRGADYLLILRRKKRDSRAGSG
jgi:hypothetical protein